METIEEWVGADGVLHRIRVSPTGALHGQYFNDGRWYSCNLDCEYCWPAQTV